MTGRAREASLQDEKKARSKGTRKKGHEDQPFRQSRENLKKRKEASGKKLLLKKDDDNPLKKESSSSYRGGKQTTSNVGTKNVLS